MTLGEAVDMLGFLFVDEATSTRDPADVEKLSTDEGAAVVEGRARRAAPTRRRGTPPSIEPALRAALVEGLGLKPRDAFGPVRVAITGRRVSPPLFESMELLGRERSLSRLSAQVR